MPVKRTIQEVHDRLVEGLARASSVEPDESLSRFVAEGCIPKGQGKLPAHSARLLAWDANSVHGFVFDSSNASAIRGASYLLKELDDELCGGSVLGLDERQILFAGGGGGLAVVSERQADWAIHRLHQLYAARTRVATCCTATVELGSGNVPFNQLYVDVRNEIARERVLRGSGVEAAVPFFAERCAACGRRSATVEAKRRNGFRLECEVCHHTIGRGKKRDTDETEDFEAIADAHKGCLAVLYFDGNGIGGRISKLPSPLAYAVFSRALDEMVRDVFESLADEYGLREEGEAEQGKGYQLPICGGDDLVAILPGDVAVPFARDLLTRFERRAEGRPDLQHSSFEGLDPIGAAAGVAIGKKNFPIRHLIEEAEELLKTAKKRVYRGGGVRSALDFAEIADGSPRRSSNPPERLEDDRSGLLLSGRPYSLREFERFSERFQRVRQAQLGQSQLYAIRRYAGQGLAQLRNHALYQVGRHQTWRNLVAELADDPDVVRDKEALMEHVVPCYGDDRVVDIADMIELYDHWREPERNATS